MDYFLFNFSGVQFHYTMSQKSKIKPSFPVCIFADSGKGRFFLFSERYLLFNNL